MAPKAKKKTTKTKTTKTKASKPKAAAPKAAPPATPLAVKPLADWDIHQGSDGKWRWSLIANNGEVLAESGAGHGGEFKTREGTIRGIRLMRKAGGTAPLPQ